MAAEPRGATCPIQVACGRFIDSPRGMEKLASHTHFPGIAFPLGDRLLEVRRSS